MHVNTISDQMFTQCFELKLPPNFLFQGFFTLKFENLWPSHLRQAFQYLLNISYICQLKINLFYASWYGPDGPVKTRKIGFVKLRSHS